MSAAAAATTQSTKTNGFGFGVEGCRPLEGRIDPPGDGAAGRRGWRTGSRNLQLWYHVTNKVKKRVNCVCIERGPKGYIYMRHTPNPRHKYIDYYTLNSYKLVLHIS